MRDFSLGLVLVTVIAGLPAGCSTGGGQAPTVAVTLRWDAPLDNLDGSPITQAITFNVYEVPNTTTAGTIPAPGSGSLVVNKLSTTSYSFTPSTDSQHCWVVTAVELSDDGTSAESAYSVAACS